MKRIHRTFFILSVSCILVCLLKLKSNAQSDTANSLNPVFKKGSIALGVGFGKKSYTGSIGLTTNVFLSRSINISLSAGTETYNGFLFSIGPEYCLQLSENYFLIAGCAWTVSSGSPYDVIDDGLQFRREYETWCNQHLRPYIGFGVSTKGAIFKFLAGNSFTQREPRYTLYQYWSDSQIKEVRDAMSSGFSFSLIVQLHNFGGRKK